MSVTIRPMRADEFDAYLEFFIPDYAAEISSNYGLSLDDAQARALQEINADLPQGVNTVGHELRCIVRGADVLGYLWYKPEKQAHSVFIYDFCIRTAYQGQGYGTQALAVFEVLMVSAGFEQIGLRVAANNKRAQQLYLKGGFHATGINMIRRIR